MASNFNRLLISRWQWCCSFVLVDRNERTSSSHGYVGFFLMISKHSRYSNVESGWRLKGVHNGMKLKLKWKTKRASYSSSPGSTQPFRLSSNFFLYFILVALGSVKNVSLISKFALICSSAKFFHQKSKINCRSQPNNFRFVLQYLVAHHG